MYSSRNTHRQAHPLRELILLSIAAALLAVGCGDDSGSMDDAPLAFDQCTGASDQAILDSVQRENIAPDGGVADGGFSGYGTQYEALQEVALNCGLGDCFEAIVSEVGTEQCMYECFADSPISGVGTNCVDCATETVNCAKGSCVVECFAGETQCRDCLWENCVPRLEECSGLSSSP